jgi:signal transduction histidine kinase
LHRADRARTLDKSGPLSQYSAPLPGFPDAEYLMPNTGVVSLLRRSFSITFAAIAAIAISVILGAIAQAARDREFRHSREVVRMARRAQLLAVDRETGVRGFLLTGDSATLSPDTAARVPLQKVLDSLVARTTDNPQQQRRAQAAAAAVARWDSTFARPAIAARERAGFGAEVPAFGTGGLAGKLLFDDVRMRFSEFEAEEEALYEARTRTANWLQVFNVLVSLLGLTILAVILAALRRRVTAQAAGLVERQTQLEEQAVELEEQASELEQQATELEAQTEELQDTVRELGRKNEELNSFSASVAHDLRSPLRSIDGFSHLLMTDHASRLDDGGKDALERIRSNAQRMGELIDGLLTLARVGGANMRRATVDLSEIASSTGDDMIRALPAGRSIDFVVHPGLAVRADPRLMRVVIHNLVDNAFKFTRARSDARVEVGMTELDGVRTFFVSDNGIGFDMRYAGKLFGAFERLHDDRAYEGLGIGLATVRRIVDRHGGRLWAESEPGQGATFYFTVPS